MKKGFKCCICGKWTLGWGKNKEFGNNPAPIKNDGECCAHCHKTVVMPTRLKECSAYIIEQGGENL